MRGRELTTPSYSIECEKLIVYYLLEYMCGFFLISNFLSRIMPTPVQNRGERAYEVKDDYLNSS